MSGVHRILGPVPGRPTVAVYGGYGFFGRLLVADVLDHTDASVIVAGRSPPAHSPFDSHRVRVVASDQHDRDSTATIIRSADVVVHCAGPYQRLPCTLLSCCVESGTPYVDLADSRDFRRRAQEVHERSVSGAVPVLCGMSFVPGLSSFLVQLVRGRFDRIASIRVFAAPGTRASRGRATFESLLSSAGRLLSVPREGHDSSRCGWTEPETVLFPPPLGRRTSYLAMEVADFDLFVEWFEAETVEFKAGSEFRWLNRALYWLGKCRATTGFPPLERLFPVFGPIIRGIGLFGSEMGGGLVEVLGTAEGGPRMERVALTAASQGPRLPIIPASIAVQGILEGRLEGVGLVPLHTALPTTWYRTQLDRRGLELWHREGQAAWENLRTP